MQPMQALNSRRLCFVCVFLFKYKVLIDAFKLSTILVQRTVRSSEYIAVFYYPTGASPVFRFGGGGHPPKILFNKDFLTIFGKFI